MSKLICPACKTVLDHDRGYLPMHTTDLQRGELVTGSKVCELSNKKVLTELVKLDYSYDCPDCGLLTEISLEETFPGQLEERKAFIEADCIGCSVEHDGYWCKHCGREVKQHADEWHITDPGSQETKVVYSQADADAHVLAYQMSNPAAANAAPVVQAALQATNVPNPALTALQAVGNLGWADVPQVEFMPAGWYPLKGGELYCDGTNPAIHDEHEGEFKAEVHKRVLLTDGHLIYEEPDGDRETEEAAHG